MPFSAAKLAYFLKNNYLFVYQRLQFSQLHLFVVQCVRQLAKYDYFCGTILYLAFPALRFQNYFTPCRRTAFCSH